MTDSIAVSARSTATRIGKALILHGIDVRIAAGRWTAIVGPNGAGKSTLLRALAGLLPTDGTVQLHGRPLADWPARERARQLAWLGQAEGGSDDLSAYDVVMLGRLPHRAWLAPPTAADHAAVQRALAEMQVAHLQLRRLGDLSGGERQRVLLARALAVQAQVLLMDEPLANLDPPHQADWLLLVRELVARGHTVVSVLHEVSFALQADDVAVLAAGRLRHHGSTQDAATHRALEQVFDQRIAITQAAGMWLALPRLERPAAPAPSAAAPVSA